MLSDEGDKGPNGSDDDILHDAVLRWIGTVSLTNGLRGSGSPVPCFGPHAPFRPLRFCSAYTRLSVASVPAVSLLPPYPPSCPILSLPSPLPSQLPTLKATRSAAIANDA